MGFISNATEHTTMTTATLDRQDPEYALLVLDNGERYDIYGEDWADLKEAAIALADHLGVKITVFNSELPEA